MKLIPTTNALSTSFMIFGSLTGGVKAAVTFTDHGNGQASVSFDSISFTASSDNDSFNAVHFEDFFSSNVNAIGSAVTGSFGYSVNGGSSMVSLMSGGVAGQHTLTSNAQDPNDLYLGSKSFVFSSGDLVTITGMNLTYSASVIGSVLPGDFSASIVNIFGSIVSNSVIVSGSVVSAAVPEPSSISLLGLGGLALTLRRRR